MRERERRYRAGKNDALRRRPVGGQWRAGQLLGYIGDGESDGFLRGRGSGRTDELVCRRCARHDACGARKHRRIRR